MEPLQPAPTPPFARLNVTSTFEDGKPEDAVAVGVGVHVGEAVCVSVAVGIGVKLGNGVNVEVGVKVGMGVAVSVGVDVGVGPIGPSYSYAPISHPLPCGRVTPRWSVAGQLAASPASIAGEPASNAMVCVIPPLSDRISRFGSPLIEAEQEASSTKLLIFVARESILKQSPLFAELAMIVLTRFKVPVL